MIVTGEEQDAASGGRPEQVAVAKDIARAVDAGPFRVPHRKDAVVIRADRHVQLLCTENGRCGEIFIYARLETDVMAFEKCFGLPELLVDQTQRRSSVTCDKAAGVQTRRFVAPPLHHGEADQRLRPCQKNAP